MMITLRLSDPLRTKLAALAKTQGISRSELIRKCLDDYLARSDAEPSAWELGKDLFGCSNSGQGDRSRRAKEIARERIHARQAERNHR
jgi:hypothetical protein